MMNIHERQVYLSSKIEFRPLGVTNPTDAEVIVEMRKEIARLRTSQYRSEQSEYGESEILNRMNGEDE
jgi:signal transduction histidine kinase